MKHALIFSVVVSLILLGAGCSSNQKESSDGLFTNTSPSQAVTPSNTAVDRSLPSMTPTKITPVQ